MSRKKTSMQIAFNLNSMDIYCVCKMIGLVNSRKLLFFLIKGNLGRQETLNEEVLMFWSKES